MAKVLVFQHVPAEPLGTLDPMLRDLGHRIRYINFHRDPDAQPDVSRYDALIILGGPQHPDQGNFYPHLLEEMRCIEDALKRDLPVLGICLGAQLLAYTLGGGVRAMDEWEIGWYKLMPTKQAATDPLFCAMKEPQPVFQWHGYTFDLPDGATRLAQSKACKNHWESATDVMCCLPGNIRWKYMRLMPVESTAVSRSRESHHEFRINPS